MKFTEEKLEQAFIELLGNEGYPHHSGVTIARKPDEVILEDDFVSFLLKRYKEQQLTETEARSILLRLKALPASDLYESNKTVMRWLSDGFILKREDRSQKDIHIELIDYRDLEAHLQGEELDEIVAEPFEKYKKDGNIYKFVNQLEITGIQLRIPDGILYVNGLPLVVFEFKSAIREDVITSYSIHYTKLYDSENCINLPQLATGRKRVCRCSRILLFGKFRRN